MQPDTRDWTSEQAHDWLRSLAPRGIQLGLDRVERALAHLGRPERRLPAVTIAGTNGKGSTAAFVSAIAHSAGYRVGLYTSPHLVDVRERIQVGGTPILPHELARWTARVRDIVEGHDIPLTYFEALTVIALVYFVEREVDLAVLEVGMGGRLDATAVVPPRVAVITQIGLDHQAYLGDTLEEICAEKAGIIQPGATVVSGVSPELFRDVIGPRAFDRRCPIRRAGVDFVPRWLHGGVRYRGWIHRVGPVRPGLAGLHQLDNAGLACAAIESLCAHGFWFKPVHIADGIQRARHACRMERRAARRDPGGRLWPAMLLDGAHNPLGARVLAEQLDAHLPERPRVLLYSSRPDKDVAGFVDAVAPLVDSVVITSLPGQPLPALEPFAERARGGRLHVEVEPDVAVALERARALAGRTGGVLAAGSLYLLGALLPMLPQRAM